MQRTKVPALGIGVVVVAILGVASRAEARTFYLSSEGDDAAAGTSEATPWRSLTELDEHMDELGPGDSVLFRRGDTFEGTITLVTSGADGSPITISSYGSDTLPLPVITGLRALTGWRSIGTELYEVDVPGHPASVAVVLRDRAILQVARFPRADAPVSGYVSADAFTTSATLTTERSVTADELASLPDLTGAQAAIRFTPWNITAVTITSSSAGRIGFLGDYVGASRYVPVAHVGFFVQNHRALIREDGDWAYDAMRGVLTMRSSSGMPSVAVSIHENLVTIDRESQIVIRELAFEGANADAIFTTYADDVRIDDCAMRFAGRRGVYSERGRRISVLRNTIEDSLEVGIEVFQPTARTGTPADTAHVARVEDNVVLRTGNFAGMGAFRDASYRSISVTSDDATIRRNVIRDGGFMGIGFYGSSMWIENNVIDRFCFVKDDGGGIYTWNGSTGEIPLWTDRHVIGNVIAHSEGAPDGKFSASTGAPGTPDVEGIYLDNNTMNVEVRGNTVYDVLGSAYYGNSNQDVTIAENTFFDVESAFGVTRYVNDSTSGGNGGQDILRLTVTDNVFFPIREAQHLYEYNDKNVDFPTASTFEARLRAMGTFDDNVLSPMSSLPVQVTYSEPDAMMRLVTNNLLPWPFGEWRRVTSYDGSSRFAEVPPDLEVTARTSSNLEPNGTFDVVPDVGTYASSGMERVAWDTSSALTGAGSLAISIDGTPQARRYVSVYDEIGPVTGGQRYLVRFRVRGPSDGIVRVQLRERGTGSATISDVQLRGYGAEASLVEVIVEATGDYAMAGWDLGFKESNTITYVDDLEVYAVDGRVVPAEERVRFEVNTTATASNVLLDGVYEDVRGGEHVGVVRLEPWTSIVMVRTGDLPPDLDAGVALMPDAAIPPGVDGGPLPDAFSELDAAIPPGVDGAVLVDGSIVAVDAGGSSLGGTCACRTSSRGEGRSAITLLSLLGLAIARRRRAIATGR